MPNHTVTLYRDDNRMGDTYGQHFYVETMNNTMVKVAYLDDSLYDEHRARLWARSVADTYGAMYVDRTPPSDRYGWSAD